MSPELETLDQLLSGDLSLAIIQRVYPNIDAFKRGVLGLLNGGDVCVLEADGAIVAEWRWRELFGENSAPYDPAKLKLRLTAQGAHRVA